MSFLEIYKKSISHNALLMKKTCDDLGISLCGVTKCCCSQKEIVEVLYEAGITTIADSNMEDFAQLSSDLAASMEKVVIKTRLSDINTIPTLPDFARPDQVFVSDEVLLDALALLPENLCPEIILIIETGDLKEGFYPDQIPTIIKKYANLPIAGVSTNYACLSGNMPSAKSIHQLCEIASLIKPKKRQSPFVSVGGTVAYFSLKEGFSQNASILQNANIELRSGEGILFGYDSSSGKELAGFQRDTFIFNGEILEIREKENVLSENIGYNALGETSKTRKAGKRLYAVLDFGILAASAKDLSPLDNDAEIVGQTFDFTVADISDSSRSYKTGETIAFAPSYGAVSFAMMNRYVKKIFCPEEKTQELFGGKR